jgi:hypothetical protein
MYLIFDEPFSPIGYVFFNEFNIDREAIDDLQCKSCDAFS